MESDKTVTTIVAFAGMFAAIWTAHIARQEQRNLRKDETTTFVIDGIGAALAIKSWARSN
jgi:hypothetical protein